MEKEMTLGSLFDGIAGFPLAAAQNGIKTIWASEIVGDCIDIVKKHFPEIQHLGDITKINGGEIPPVDIISFGSPCQNLSTAGNQKKGRISAECLKKSQKPTFQCLIVEDGQQAEWLEAPQAVQLGDSWTLNTGECPSVENVSTLYTILTENVPQKYYLSAKACLGILRRAEQRGRTLPEVLETALKQQAQEQQQASYH